MNCIQVWCNLDKDIIDTIGRVFLLRAVRPISSTMHSFSDQYDLFCVTGLPNTQYFTVTVHYKIQYN